MTGNKSDFVFIEHIKDALEKITEFMGGCSLDEFTSNDLISSAVIRKLEIIGEAANKVSANFRSNNPQIPWSKMVGLRNILIHEYFGIDLEIVWQTVKNELPKLRQDFYKIQ